LGKFNLSGNSWPEHEIIENTEEHIVYYLDLHALIPEFNKFKELYLREINVCSSNEPE